MEKPSTRVGIAVEQEDALDVWWKGTRPELGRILERYKTWVSSELRMCQSRLAKVTEERDIVVREVLSLRRTIEEIKEKVNKK